MAKLKGNHASKKSQATAYKMLCKAGKNKALKLARHLKKHPSDGQAQAAVKGARDYKGRTQPKRTGARLNPFIGEIDKIALAEVMIREKQAGRDELNFQSRSLNLLNGRISAFGHRVAQHLKFSRAVRNEAMYDKKAKAFPKPMMTKADREAAKARALGKQSSESAAKQKKAKVAQRKSA